MQNRKIKPKLLSGFQDFLPETMIPKQKIINQLIEVFEYFGFLPLETPCLERSSVLGTDQNEFKMEVYRFNDNPKGKGRDVSLRFDLTLPLSRVIAANPDLIKPFKRYQIGKVFRKEKAQAGRYREFSQLDIDIVGSNSILADIEILQIIYQSLKALDLDKFLIKFSNRKLLNGLAEICELKSKKAKQVFRILDKLEKIGFNATLKDLKKEAELTDSQISKIKQFLEISKEKEIISKLKKFFQKTEIGKEGIKEIQEIIDQLKELKIPEKNWRFDLSIARGLEYYTGLVFETELTEIPEIGAVFSGGRYDQLIKRFTGEKMPAIGASVGIDRLIAALEKINKFEKTKATAQVLIARLEKELDSEIMLLAKELRKNKIKTEIYLGESNMLKEQIIYAAKREIPYLIILGQEEKQQGKIKLKNMNQRTEELLTQQELIQKFAI